MASRISDGMANIYAAKITANPLPGNPLHGKTENAQLSFYLLAPSEEFFLLKLGERLSRDRWETVRTQASGLVPRTLLRSSPNHGDILSMLESDGDCLVVESYQSDGD